MTGQKQAVATIYTIGHSNHPAQLLLDLLRDHRIEVLVDVRSRPYARYTPHFDQQPLRAAVLEMGCKYLYLGKELGGRPEDRQFYDPDGHVLYGRVAAS